MSPTSFLVSYNRKGRKYTPAFSS